MRKGPFLIIFRYEITDIGVICDFSEAQIIAHPLHAEEQMLSHRQAWKTLSRDKALRNTPFDYYPRGRVELRRGKAIIFMNPRIMECPEAERLICEVFRLAGKIEIKADNSPHYRCGADELSLL